jgi:hypothetical protein
VLPTVNYSLKQGTRTAILYWSMALLIVGLQWSLLSFIRSSFRRPDLAPVLIASRTATSRARSVVNRCVSRTTKTQRISSFESLEKNARAKSGSKPHEGHLCAFKGER